jgi:hypothetical protein
MLDRAFASIESGTNQAGQLIFASFGTFRAGLETAFKEFRVDQYIKDYKGSIAEFTTSWNGLMMALGDSNIPEHAMLRFNMTMAQMNVLLDQQVITIDTLNNVIPVWHTWLLKMTEAEKARKEQEKWTEAANELVTSLDDQYKQMVMSETQMIRLSDAYLNASKAQKDLIESGLARLAGVRKDIEGTRRLTEEINRQVKGAQELANIRRKFIEGSEDAQVAIRRRLQLAAAETDLDKLAIKQAEERYNWLIAIEPAERRAAAIEIDRLHAMEMASEIADQYATNVKRLNDRLADMKLETLASQFRLMETIIEGIADSMVDAFEAIVTGSGNAGEAVINMIRDIAKELLKAQIMAFLFDLAASKGWGPFKSINATNTSTPRSTMDFFRASGGHTKANQSYVVGERGPEIFVPSVSGSVVPNNKVGTGGEQLTIVNHYTIQALDGASVRSILTQEQDTIAGLAIDKINRHRSLKRL